MAVVLIIVFASGKLRTVAAERVGHVRVILLHAHGRTRVWVSSSLFSRKHIFPTLHFLASVAMDHEQPRALADDGKCAIFCKSTQTGVQDNPPQRVVRFRHGKCVDGEHRWRSAVNSCFSSVPPETNRLNYGIQKTTRGIVTAFGIFRCFALVCQKFLHRNVFFWFSSTVVWAYSNKTNHFLPSAWV